MESEPQVATLNRDQMLAAVRRMVEDFEVLEPDEKLAAVNAVLRLALADHSDVSVVVPPVSRKRRRRR